MSDTLKSKIESLLFIAGRPLSLKKIAEILDAKKDDVEKEAKELLQDYATSGRGIHIMKDGTSLQMATTPNNAKLIQDFIKSEQTGELTRPSLETLTIVAYRGPISKTELEQIRGVNCSLILRNLMIRGLVEANFDRKLKTTVYSITMPFLEFLGISSAEELPDFEKLHSDERLKTLLQMQEGKPSQEGVQTAPESKELNV